MKGKQQNLKKTLFFFFPSGPAAAFISPIYNEIHLNNIAAIL
jgi:hypothetical protein